jgi:hypothetical protein
VVLTCGSSRFTLLTLPVEDYPALPAMPGASGSLRGDAFATAVAQVSIAAGRDDTLPVLTGVRLEIEGEKITMAATDRYRLAVRDLAWTPEQTGLSVVALVPARTLSETAKSLASADKVTLALASATGGAGEGSWSSRVPGGARRRGCSTASSPNTARCFPPSRRASPRRDRRAHRVGRGSRWLPSATHRSGSAFTAGELTSRGRHRR